MASGRRCEVREKSEARRIVEEAGLDEEKQAVIQYALEHARGGYRQLRWTLVAGTWSTYQSSVYRILRDGDLLY